jgi:hypothetical protein
MAAHDGPGYQPVVATYTEAQIGFSFDDWLGS